MLALFALTGCGWQLPAAPATFVRRASPVFTSSAIQMVVTPPSAIEQLKSTYTWGVVTSGSSAFFALARPVQAVIVAGIVGFVVGANELRKRDELIEAGEECMLGDDNACETYDEAVDKTPIWKLQRVAEKLVQTNTLADKMSGAPPPAGFAWGKSS